MKAWVTILVPLAALACNSPGGNEVPKTSDPPEPGASVSVGEPVQLTGGLPALVGVTRDDFVIYRDPGGLSAIAMQGGSQPLLITDRSGTTLIAGKVVFVWANVDWTTNLGDMTIWTAASGPQHVGTTLFLDGTVSASESGTHVLYATNVTETTLDLVVARTDMTAQTTLIAGVGRGSEFTCAPRYGFVGDRIFVGSCTEGSQAGTVVRYDLDAQGAFQPTEIATNVRPAWSASADGERVAIIDNRSNVNWWEAGRLTTIDDGIAWAMMVPDGSAVLYRVGDQLRRADLPNAEPVPIVTVGFRMGEWSPDFSHVLYWTQMTYEGGTRRDLRITNTQVYNPQPESLVADPVASLPRSVFTKDGAFALYLTDVTPERHSTLNLRPVAGGEARTIANVDEALAVSGSLIVFSADRTDPNRYPVKATLHVFDTMRGEPIVLEDTILDGRAFSANATGDQVVYVRVDDDRDRQGLYVQSISPVQE